MNEIRRFGFLVTDSESLTQYSTYFYPPPPPTKVRCESVVSVSQPVAGRLPTDDTGPSFPPSASLALKDQVQNEDDDDGQDDYHSGAEAQNMFNLKQKSRFMYLCSACVFILAAMSAKMFSVLS